MNTITTLLKSSITKKQITFIIQIKANNIFLTEQYFNKKQNINNSIINNTFKKDIVNNSDNILNVKKDYSYKTYVSKIHKSQIAYVGNNLYKRSGNRTFNNTNNIYKHINQHESYVFNTYKINKTHNVKKTCYNYNSDVINRTNTITTNGTYNITKNIDLYNVTDNNYYTKKSIIPGTSLITLHDITITIMNTM